MKSTLIVILGILFVGNSTSDMLSEDDPFSVDDIKIDQSKNRPLYGEVKDVKQKGFQKKKGDQNKDVVKKENGNKDITIVPSKPIITGQVEQTTIKREQPTVRSVKTVEPGNLMESLDETTKKVDSTGSQVGSQNEKKMDQTPKEVDPLDDGQKKGEKINPNVDVPESILKAVEEKEKSNLRSETAKVTTEDKQETESTDEEVKKMDPIIKSLEGAEKKLSEAFGAVRSKLNSVPKGHKPIKVDCGTTRVRVVCSKKKKSETDSDDQESSKKEDSGKESEGDSKEGDKKSEDSEMNESAESDGEETEVYEDEDEE